MYVLNFFIQSENIYCFYIVDINSSWFTSNITSYDHKCLVNIHRHLQTQDLVRRCKNRVVTFVQKSTGTLLLIFPSRILYMIIHLPDRLQQPYNRFALRFHSIPSNSAFSIIFQNKSDSGALPHKSREWRLNSM